MIIRPSFSGLYEKNVEPPLDITGMPTARLAYGLRKLRSAYTGAALRVRRSSDDTEADVYFYNQKEVTLNSLTSAGSTLRDFVGSDTAYVTKWYNQSAEATKPDATQTTTSKQPELISAGTFNKGIKFVTAGGYTAAGAYLQVNSYRLPNTDDNFSLVMACEVFDFTGAGGLITNLDNFNDGAEMIYLSGGSYRLAVDAYDEDSASGYPTYTRTIVSSYYDRSRSSAQGGDGKSMILRVSGVETTRDVNEDKHIGRSDRFRIGCRRINNNPFNGIIREAFVWESAVSDALKLLLEDNLAIYNEVDL